MKKYSKFDIREYVIDVCSEVHLVEYHDTGSYHFTRKTTTKQAEKLELIIDSALNVIFDYEDKYDKSQIIDIVNGMASYIVRQDVELFGSNYGKDVHIDVEKSIVEPIINFFE